MTDATLRVHLNIGPSARDCRVTCEVTRDDSTEPAGYAVELISSDVELDYEWEQVELEAIDEAKRIWAERDASVAAKSKAAVVHAIQNAQQGHEDAIRRSMGMFNAQPGIEAAEKELRQALERARVVAVLDGWAVRYQGQHTTEYKLGQSICWLSGYTKVGYPMQTTHYVGDDQNAARAAAAKAIEAQYWHGGKVCP